MSGTSIGTGPWAGPGSRAPLTTGGSAPIGSKGGSARRRRRRRTRARIPRHSSAARTIAMTAKPHGHCVVVAANANV